MIEGIKLRFPHLLAFRSSRSSPSPSSVTSFLVGTLLGGPVSAVVTLAGVNQAGFFRNGLRPLRTLALACFQDSCHPLAADIIHMLFSKSFNINELILRELPLCRFQLSRWS